MLRFPEFAGEWEEKRFDRFLNPHFREVPTPNSNYLSIGVRSHGKGTFQRLDSDPAKIAMESLFVVRSNDLVVSITFAWEGAIAIAKLQDDGGLVSHRFPTYQFKSGEVTPEFFQFIIDQKRFRRKLELISPGGAGRNRVMSKSEFLKLSHVFPTPLEQKRIAVFLRAVDEKLIKLKRKLNLLTKYKLGVMQKIFSQKIRFKRDNGFDFPDWEEKKLGDFIEIISGLTYSPSDIRDKGLLVLRSSNVQDRKIELKDNVYVDLEVPSKNLSQPGDILLCVRNGSRRLIGKSARIPHGLPKATHGAFMSVLRGMKNDFVFQVLHTPMYYRQVHINLGATINSINGSDLKKFSFFLPDDANEQQKIADFLFAIDAKIDATTSQITIMEVFKKGLLQQMFV